jgi:hypothetical protein
MERTVSFTWNLKSCHAVIIPPIDEQNATISALLKEDELVKKFGSCLSIDVFPKEEMESVEDEQQRLKKLVLEASSNLPEIAKILVPRKSTTELEEKLKLLETDYAKRFGGLNNHKLLSDIWLRIKIIKEELGRREGRSV